MEPGPIPVLETLRVPAGRSSLPLTEAPGLRLASYNILADGYATSDYSQKFLYPYVSLDHLNSEYRTLLALRELHSYSADVILLQEVRRSVAWRRLGDIARHTASEGRRLMQFLRHGLFTPGGREGLYELPQAGVWRGGA